jgi:hypothetical protein
VLLATGMSQGIVTFLGRSVSAYNTLPATHYDMQWDFNEQALLPAQFLLEVGYHGSRTVRLLAARKLGCASYSVFKRLSDPRSGEH